MLCYYPGFLELCYSPLVLVMFSAGFACLMRKTFYFLNINQFLIFLKAPSACVFQPFFIVTNKAFKKNRQLVSFTSS